MAVPTGLCLVCICACTEPDPTYCDETHPCPPGLVCDLPAKTCVKPDAGLEAGVDAPSDAELPADGLSGDRPNGAPCGLDAECASGHCADQVCCDTACAGACRSCALSGAEGTCTPVPAGQDPAADCAGTDPACAGTCDGAGACAFPDSTKTCAGPTCAAGEVTEGTCDNAGACDKTTTSCGGFACDAAQTACLTSCAGPADCVAGFSCEGNVCAGSLPLGQACGTNDKACASGHCADGVCCDGACDGPCQACNLAGASGTCSPLPMGTISPADCPGDGACGPGSCDGAGSCLYPKQVGEICASTCFNALVTVSTCDAAHACTAGNPTSCGLYVCDAANVACLTSCSGQTDCAPGAYCDPPTCVAKKQNGAICASDTECTSGICQATDKVCCDAACTGPCESCLLTKGTCTPEPAGTLCGAADSCIDSPTSSFVEQNRCDGTSGATCPKTTVQCTPYRCASSSACATSCTDNTGCTTKLCDLHDSVSTCPPASDICFVAAGATGGSGSQAAPFATVGQCLATSKPYVSVASGTYPENLAVAKKVQIVAADVQPAVFSGGAPTVLLKASAAATPAIDVTSGGDLYLYGLDVTSSAQDAHLLQLAGTAQATLVSCHLHDSVGTGDCVRFDGAELTATDSRLVKCDDGIDGVGSKVTLKQVRLEGNTQTGLYSSGPATLHQVVATGSKMGIFASDAVDFDRVVASDNTMYGVFLEDTPGTISNLLAFGNGVGIHIISVGLSALTLTNVTVAHNQNGGVQCLDILMPVDAAFTNSIIWNTSSAGAFDCMYAKVTYSNVVGGATGTGNINVDPQFVDPTGAKDFHLKPTSPCKDKGDPSSTGLPVHDLDGNPRVVNGKVDMGAYEVQ